MRPDRIATALVTDPMALNRLPSDCCDAALTATGLSEALAVDACDQLVHIPMRPPVRQDRMADMDGHLILVDGSEREVTAENVKRLLDSSARFWLDLAGLDQDTGAALLRDTFGFHPLAVEDAEHFGQRPKLDSYDEFALLVVYGATPAGQLVEVHCFYTENYLVTVHHDPCLDLVALADRLRQRAGPHPDHVMLLYRVVDSPGRRLLPGAGRPRRPDRRAGRRDPPATHRAAAGPVVRHETVPDRDCGRWSPPSGTCLPHC